MNETSIHDVTPDVPYNGSNAILSVRGLSKQFVVRRNALGTPREHLKAVDDVSFHLEKGETLALVGGSGSGKSTTARLIARLEKPDQGRILVDGVNWTRMRQRDIRRYRRNMQMIFQNPFASLDPTKMVVHLVGEPLTVHDRVSGRELDNRVLSLLNDVGLPPNALNKYPHEFSGGQRQRIAIARSIAADPAIIIADEAVSALDVSTQAKVLNLLKDLQQERNLAILFITHDLGVVRQIAHHVAVMNKGRLVEQGDVDQVFAKPKEDYTRELLASVPVLGRWRETRG